ncbi:regulator of G protein signaling [Tilletiaria anomala UBC 951]|uniref:Regulator of G protein signaling n=1 Tax=Tilletiaria anomala (strain ATCC 24038 / CBS 436.72 / UBC 951) TaxID=1037660 RepID=A0A066VXL1_TILAU|nr:regulator of G protein signaling [Tilletiaria anomala UBC 951]KDN46442.1 regulator of G protein signaling [Tilletiaria anomala UBC 951]
MSDDNLPKPAQTRRQVSSRMMKTSRRGRPFTKDTHDLFATLIVSLELPTHRVLFKSYPNSFTTDEAAENLAALKFSQSNRVPDPNEPNRVITTTTTTTFTMNREMAKGICQHFMDARLIENAQDPSGTVFKDKGIWMLTPKGLHILERFITKNGINGEHLLKVFSSQPICMKLLHLERHRHDDELVINTMVVEVIFRRFVGRQPNYPSKSANGTNAEFDRTLGVEMMDVAERSRNGQLRAIKHTFSAVTALEWLLDFSTLAGRDEAGEVCAHFERLDLIELIADKPRSAREASKPDPNNVVVRGEDIGGMIIEGEFRCHPKAIYGMTARGREVARWEGYYRPPPEPAEHHLRDTRSIPSDSMRHHPGPRSISGGNDAATVHSDADSTRFGSEMGSRAELADPGASGGISVSKDSNATRLRQILEEPALRSLFREFLKRNFCEENLSFWLDVQDFKRRFHTTSSAVAMRSVLAESKASSSSMATKMASKLRGGGSDVSDASNPSCMSATERHQQDLITMTFVIYNTYLAPGSPCELNIEHNLRTELVTYVTKIVSDASANNPNNGGKNSSSGSRNVTSPTASDLSLVPHSAAELELPAGMANGAQVTPTSLEDRKQLAGRPKIPMHASQVQTMVRLYQRIQDHIFRLMATDSVPRFIKDTRFLNLVRSVEEYSRALEAGHVDPRINAGPGESLEAGMN